MWLRAGDGDKIILWLRIVCVSLCVGGVVFGTVFEGPDVACVDWRAKPPIRIILKFLFIYFPTSVLLYVTMSTPCSCIPLSDSPVTLEVQTPKKEYTKQFWKTSSYFGRKKNG